MRRSVVRKTSYGSVTVYSLDPKLLRKRLRTAVRAAASAREDIEKVILFGSLATGGATPSSDADILIVIAETDLRFIDRPTLFIDYFAPLGIDVDLFVYTADEVARRMPFVDRAIETGEVLHERGDPAVRGRGRARTPRNVPGDPNRP